MPYLSQRRRVRRVKYLHQNRRKLCSDETTHPTGKVIIICTPKALQIYPDMRILSYQGKKISVPSATRATNGSGREKGLKIFITLRGAEGVG